MKIMPQGILYFNFDFLNFLKIISFFSGPCQDSADEYRIDEKTRQPVCRPRKNGRKIKRIFDVIPSNLRRIGDMEADSLVCGSLTGSNKCITSRFVSGLTGMSSIVDPRMGKRHGVVWKQTKLVQKAITFLKWLRAFMNHDD
jgi:hypothetical protein